MQKTAIIEHIERVIVILIVFFFSISLILSLTELGNKKTSEKSINSEYALPFKVKDTTIWVDVAETNEEKVLGLSGQEGLTPNQGLLFVFAEEGSHGIWMKDMKFPIDILWIDRNHRIVHIENRVSPDTFPKAFSSSSKSVFVLELMAGFVEEHQIQVGDLADFSIKPS